MGNHLRHYHITRFAIIYNPGRFSSFVSLLISSHALPTLSPTLSDVELLSHGLIMPTAHVLVARPHDTSFTCSCPQVLGNPSVLIACLPCLVPHLRIQPISMIPLPRFFPHSSIIPTASGGHRLLVNAQ
ncbi:hypothetical protein SCLCIDRAFT_1207252 [Scleroderma citrinum Foug A]|uniref:Uncharacterized protein n=1 Tax=Scleroderma citrinum Foug A TaxID=1036808 RepID=A0A0C3EB79_9AGAM|nr:hypothetical protein SCLCIDRAFT_1207252 [Scleroderma citrinum Foug A]